MNIFSFLVCGLQDTKFGVKNPNAIISHCPNVIEATHENKWRPQG